MERMRPPGTHRNDWVNRRCCLEGESNAKRVQQGAMRRKTRDACASRRFAGHEGTFNDYPDGLESRVIQEGNGKTII